MITTIKLTTETKKRLFKYGKYGDTMDCILNEIMDRLDKLEDSKK